MQDLIRLFCDSADKFFAQFEAVFRRVWPRYRSGHSIPDSIVRSLHRDLEPKREELLRVGGPLPAILERNNYDSSGLLAFLNAIEDWNVQDAPSLWPGVKVALQRIAIRSPLPAPGPNEGEEKERMGFPMPLPTKARSTKPAGTAPKIPKLSDRQYNILVAMLELRALTAESLAATDKIAARAEGATASPEQFKRPVSGLKRRKLVDTKTGRDGGCWLTDKGRELAELIKKRRDEKR